MTKVETKPVEPGRTPVYAERTPVDAGGNPVEADRASVDAAGNPVDADRAPVDAGRKPVDAGRKPVEADRASVKPEREPVERGRTGPDDDELVAIARQLGMFMRRAERLHAGVLSDAAGHGLERAGYMLLGRIAGGGPARLSALAGDMCVDLSVVSRQVAALEAAGLVTRTPDPADRRASLIAATAAGAEVFARNRERWLATLQDLLADWTTAERREFARLFARFNEAIATRQETQTWIRQRPPGVTAKGPGGIAQTAGPKQ